MKSERRHELQQNELAEQLEKAKTWIEPYAVPILVVVIAVTVVGMGVNYYQSMGVASRSDATLELLFAGGGPAGTDGDAEAYGNVAKNHPDSKASEIAKLAQADIFLARGIEALFRDRDEADGLLADALSVYEKVGEEASTTLLKSRAFFGAAQANESQGNIDAAIEAYKTVVQLNESTAMVNVAKQRMELLEEEGVKNFVAWFGEQKPAEFPPMDVPGLSPGSGIPGMPDFEFPGVNPPDSGAGTPSMSETLGNVLGGQASDQPLTENPDIPVPPENAQPESPGDTTPLAAPPQEGNTESKSEEASATESGTSEPAENETTTVDPPTEVTPPATENPPEGGTESGAEGSGGTASGNNSP